jgi:hypothetical protein
MVTAPEIKGKAIPLHALEALGGRGGIAPTHSRPRHYMGVSGQRQAPAALLPLGERTPGTHCPGGWVGPRAGLDTEVRGKILCPRRGPNPNRPVVQPVVRHYTAWANPAPNSSRGQRVFLHSQATARRSSRKTRYVPPMKLYKPVFEHVSAKETFWLCPQMKDTRSMWSK